MEAPKFTDVVQAPRRYSSRPPGVLLLVGLAATYFAAYGNAIEAQDHRPISPHDLVEVRDIGGHELYNGALSVSPSRKYIAFQLQVPDIEARNYDLSWWVVETRVGGKSWYLVDGGEIILNPTAAPAPVGRRHSARAQWSPDSAWIYYLKRIDGRTQVWRTQIHGSTTEQLTDHELGDVLSFQLSDDGRSIFFNATSAVETEHLLRTEADRGYLFDERFDAFKKKVPIARVCGTNVWGGKRKVGVNRRCAPLLWVYDLEDKEERRATAEEISLYELGRSSDLSPSTVASGNLTDKRNSGDFVELVNENPEAFPGVAPPLRISASLDGQSFRCYSDHCNGYKGEIKNVWWRPGHDEIVFLRDDGASKSMSGLYSWAPRDGLVRTIVKTDDKITDCQILVIRAICLREQWTRPATIASINLDTGQMELIYEPNPDFDEIEFSKVEKIVAKDGFGNAAHAHLVYPLGYDSGRRYPLVVTTYQSRGFLRGAQGDEYPIHVLAANGFMVLSYHMPWPSQRYAARRDVIRAQFEDNYERRSALSALLTILETLKLRGLIDTDRIAITGLSDGESQVKFAITQTKKFAAAIVSAARDYGTVYYSYNKQERKLWRSVLGGSPDEDKEGLYNILSIGRNAESLKAPLLVNVSDQEFIASVESVVRLQDAGRPVEMYVYPGEYHFKWQPQHRLAIYRRNIQWLKFWLMGEEESDPVSPGQYERWRKMRDERCAWDEPEDDRPAYCAEPIN